MQRFLDAGFELLARAESGKEFTVQEVVDRSGQSLRSFYQYFAGKHELLLALFDEAILSTADRLEEQIARQSTPLERLHCFVVEYYRMCLPAPKGRASKNNPTPVMAEFCHQLLTSHQTEASRAFVPLVTLLEKVLDDAATAGDIAPGLRSRRRWPASSCRRSCSTRPMPRRSVAARSRQTATTPPRSSGTSSRGASSLDPTPEGRATSGRAARERPQRGIRACVRPRT